MSIVNFLMTFLCSVLAASSLCTAMPVYTYGFPAREKAEEKEFLAKQDQVKAELKIFN